VIENNQRKKMVVAKKLKGTQKIPISESSP
jgi:hypothetical protein